MIEPQEARKGSDDVLGVPNRSGAQKKGFLANKCRFHCGRDVAWLQRHRHCQVIAYSKLYGVVRLHCTHTMMPLSAILRNDEANVKR